METIENEIVKELKEIQMKNKELLKELVIERTKYTSDNRFKIEELRIWSQYFNISILYFLKEILKISNEEYSKLLKGQITRIKSNEFNALKEKIILQKHKIYYLNRNLNRRNYFDRNKICKESQRLQINSRDYVLKILKKNRASFTRVMKDTESKARLFIGEYVNDKLPECYIENNYNDMIKVFAIALNKICIKLGKTIKMQDKEDFIQDCMCYIIANGNIVDKYKNPIIKDSIALTKYKKIIYIKSYFYFLNKLKKYEVETCNYDDKIKYQAIEDTEYNDVEEYIDKIFKDELTKNIFKMIYKEGNIDETKEKISKMYKISIEEIDQIIRKYTESIMF